MTREPLADGLPLDLREEIYRLEAENEQLRAALRECGADWKSEPGTVMGTAGQVAREFKRRMQIAADVLEPKP